jgi:hypothetical protein
MDCNYLHGGGGRTFRQDCNHFEGFGEMGQTEIEWCRIMKNEEVIVKFKMSKLSLQMRCNTLMIPLQ